MGYRRDPQDDGHGKVHIRDCACSVLGNIPPGFWVLDPAISKRDPYRDDPSNWLQFWVVAVAVPLPKISHQTKSYKPVRVRSF